MEYRVNNDSCKGIGSNKILFSVGLYYLLAVLCTQKLHLSRINQRKSHQSVDSWMQHLFCNTARVSKATGWFGNWQCLKPSRCTEPLPDFFKEIQEQPSARTHIHTQKQTETYWSESKHGPTGLGGALPATELPKHCSATIPCSKRASVEVQLGGERASTHLCCVTGQTYVSQEPATGFSCCLGNMAV